MGLRKWLRWLVVPLAVLAFLAVSGAGAQPEGPTRELYGCRNGPSGVGPCEDFSGNLGWVSGAVSAPHALYRMGDFAPTRLVLRRLLPGREYTIRIGWTAMKSGLHGYDYLGSYDASVQPNGLLDSVTPCRHVQETAGNHSCTSAAGADTQPIPPDTHTTFPNGTHPPRSGTQHFSLWGASFNGASSYFYGCATCLPILPSTRADRERQIDVTFTTPSECPGGPPVVGSCTAILAWGGHIASARDWGFGRTYAELGGGTAGFHMKTIHARVGGTTYSLGGAEVPLSVSATGRLHGFTTNVTPTEVVVQGPGGPGQPVTDRATLLGYTSAPVRPVTGRVHFFVCGPTASAAACTQNGVDLGTVELARIGTTANADATSPPFTPSAPGFFCFRVVYEPNDTAYYSPRVHTSTTNECFRAVAARIRVTKLCDPTTDPGHFNILFDGAQLGEPDVACGGSRPATGYFNVATPGAHTVSEAAGTGTSLTDYTTTRGGDCDADGSITLELGSVSVCEITNTVISPLPAAPASLTLTKVCVPATDTGLFEMRIDGAPVAVLRCGESTTAPVEVAPGSHTVAEVGISPTSLSDYTTTFGATCPGGSITLAPDQDATCVITNTRRPGITPPTTLRVDKVCVPAGGRGRFNLTINGAVAGTGEAVGCRGTTGVIPVAPGAHTVGETGANGTNLSRYRVVIGGDCAANGTITVATGQQATCLITNLLRSVPTPPALCPTLTLVSRRMVNTGAGVRVVARVHLGGRPIEAVHVFAVGPGVSAFQRTGRTGHAVFVLNLPRPGILTLRILRAFGCPEPHPRRIGVLGVAQTFLTG